MKDETQPSLFEVLAEVGQAQLEAENAYKAQCDEFWNKLSYDEKLMAFSSVVSRIHKGDVVDRGSYRYVLYDVFGFDWDSYAIGMQCGYLAVHNLIADGLYQEKGCE